MHVQIVCNAILLNKAGPLLFGKLTSTLLHYLGQALSRLLHYLSSSEDFRILVRRYVGRDELPDALVRQVVLPRIRNLGMT